MKPGRGLRTWAQRHLNVTFAVGFLLVLLTYLVVSRQLAVAAPGGTGILTLLSSVLVLHCAPITVSYPFPGRTRLSSSLR